MHKLNGDKFECPNHKGENSVLDWASDVEEGVEHITFACGCTVEIAFGMTSTDSDIKKPTVGDIVLFGEDLYRLDDLQREPDGIWASIINIHGEEQVVYEALTYVGKDTLTGTNKIWTPSPKKVNKYFDDSNYEYGKYDNYKKRPAWWDSVDQSESQKKFESGKKYKGRKFDGLSASGLIKHEVNKLSAEPEDENKPYISSTPTIQDHKNNIRKLRLSPSSQRPADENEDEEPVKPLPKRKGEW